MRSRVRLLRALYEDGMYVIDERSIADAILARAHVRATIPDVGFAEHRTSVRSFRHDSSARSFRLARPAMRRAAH
jgi:hypothetical protein